MLQRRFERNGDRGRADVGDLQSELPSAMYWQIVHAAFLIVR
jgi:hypothetical protein